MGPSDDITLRLGNAIDPTCLREHLYNFFSRPTLWNLNAKLKLSLTLSRWSSCAGPTGTFVGISATGPSEEVSASGKKLYMSHLTT